MYGTPRRITRTTVAAVLAAAGLPAAALASPDTSHTKSASDVAATGVMATVSHTALSFHTLSSLIGSPVLGADGSEIATVEDLIIDRGSGQIRHVVLSTGGFLDIGDKQVAAPLAEFSLAADRDDASIMRLKLPTYERVLDNRVAFDRDRWLGLEADRSWFGDMQAWASDVIDSESEDDYVAQRTFVDADTKTIRGTIAAIERESVDGNDEHVIVRVRTESGETKPVAVGPAWFVQGRDLPLTRGKDARVTVFDDKHDGHWHAKRIAIGGEHVDYRNDKGEPTWTSDDVKASGGDASDGNSPTRFFLASDVLGMPAHTMDDERGETSGEIDDAVVELTSGKLLMLGLDPNTNVLGIGDELKCVPMTIASIGAERVTLDAPTSVLAACEEMPDNVQVFVESVRYEPVFASFDVKPVRLDRSDANRDGTMSNDAKGRDARSGRDAEPMTTGTPAARANLAMLKAFRNGDEVTVKGIAKSFGSMTFPGTDTKVKTVTLLTTDLESRDTSAEARSGKDKASKQDAAKHRTIVLGPVDWVDEHGTNITVGSSITVDGRLVTEGDTQVVMANWVSNGSNERMVLWRDNRPTWHDSYQPVSY